MSMPDTVTPEDIDASRKPAHDIMFLRDLQVLDGKQRVAVFHMQDVLLPLLNKPSLLSGHAVGELRGYYDTVVTLADGSPEQQSLIAELKEHLTDMLALNPGVELQLTQAAA